MPDSTRGSSLSKRSAATQATTDAVAGLTVASVSPRRMAYMRFRAHKAASVSVVILAFLVIYVLMSPLTTRYGVNEAWFGTDSIGRDLYSRIIFGLRVSLLLGILASAFSLAVGVAVGSYAGLKGGRFDDVVMRLTDVFLAFPFLVALLVIRNVLGAVPWITAVIGEPSSIRFLVVLFTIFGWMGVARILRAQVMALKEREFVEAARAAGATNWYIIRKHLIPNSTGPILVALSLGVVGVIVSEATLSLFGYGPSPGDGATSLGLLVAESKLAVRAGYWCLALYPFAALLLVTLCVSFIGDGLRDAFDPKQSVEQ